MKNYRFHSTLNMNDIYFEKKLHVEFSLNKISVFKV